MKRNVHYNNLLYSVVSSENCILSDMGCPWQECYDETTGYPYYWNVNTNAVTWEMPHEYKLSLSGNSSDQTSGNSQKSSISNKLASSSLARSSTFKTLKDIKLAPNRVPRKSSDSEDEKIELITSYGEESESDEDISIKSRNLNKFNSSSVKSTVDIPKVPIGPTIIYRIQPEPQVIKPVKTEAELLDYNLKPPTQLDIRTIVNKINRDVDTKSTELSPPVDQARLVHGNEIQDMNTENHQTGTEIDDIIAQIEKERPPDMKKNIETKVNKTNTLISLVAGYGEDSDNEDEDIDDKSETPPIKTLFPITEAQDNLKTIENTQEMINSPSQTKNILDDSEDFDSKTFKRKRRIALDVLPTKKTKPDIIISNSMSDPDESPRTGFGFQKSTETSTKESPYEVMKFKQGGISFVKAETINTPNETVSETDSNNIPTTQVVENDKVDGLDVIDGLDDMAELIRQKIQFLEEGKEPVSAVQIMSIKFSTLFEAYEAKGVTGQYLFDWLKATTTELNKLEQAAVPAGWFCQWDRSNKRYFYRNHNSGHTQWEYPDADIVGGAEAMDICTTPPPPEETEAVQEHSNVQTSTVETIVPPLPPPQQLPKTPPPPSIRDKSPTPPPPPRISQTNDNEFTPSVDQPLPPGVDSTELSFTAEDKINNDTKNENNLGSELESFYSDLASLDNAPVIQAEVPIKEEVNIVKSLTEKTQETKKKKKKSTKLGSSFTLKNKEVSLLVEKWKKVQNDF